MYRVQGTTGHKVDVPILWRVPRSLEDNRRNISNVVKVIPSREWMRRLWPMFWCTTTNFW
jgi:hypothetical protein